MFSSTGINRLASLAIFVFFASNLSWAKGYSIGSVLLLLVGICALFACRPNIQRDLHSVVAACLIMVLAGLWAVFYHNEPLRELDLPLRYVGAIVLLWAGADLAPRLWVWWTSIILGCISAAGIAFYDTAILDLHRATGFTGGIRFGNIGLMLGVFCTAGLVGLKDSKPGRARWLAQLALITGTLCGLYASIASGTRGGWVAIPVAVVLFGAALIPAQCTLRWYASASVLAVMLIIVGLKIPMVEQRYQETMSNLQAFEHGENRTSVGLRLAVWQAAVRMIAEKPLAGWGSNGYHKQLHKGANSGLYSSQVKLLAHTHNTYLEAWLKYGVLGIVGVVSLLVSVFWLFAKYLRHNNRSVQALALCGTCLAAMYAVFSTTHTMLGRNNSLLFFLVTTAVLWSMIASVIKNDSFLKHKDGNGTSQ